MDNRGLLLARPGAGQRDGAYLVGIAALHPEVPANRWRATLDRYFELPTQVH
jgi:hypothetical protein